MRINFKARLKNKSFLMGAGVLIVSFVYHFLALLDVVPNVSENEVIEVLGMLLNVLAMFGVVADPTTAGLGDSERALSYYTENSYRLRRLAEY